MNKEQIEKTRRLLGAGKSFPVKVPTDPIGLAALTSFVAAGRKAQAAVDAEIKQG